MASSWLLLQPLKAPSALSSVTSGASLTAGASSSRSTSSLVALRLSASAGEPLAAAAASVGSAAVAVVVTLAAASVGSRTGEHVRSCGAEQRLVGQCALSTGGTSPSSRTRTWLGLGLGLGLGSGLGLGLGIAPSSRTRTGAAVMAAAVRPSERKECARSLSGGATAPPKRTGSRPLWTLSTKCEEHLRGKVMSGGAPGKVQLVEASEAQSKCGSTSVRLSTRAIASASRSACSCRRISSTLARSRLERRRTWSGSGLGLGPGLGLGLGLALGLGLGSSAAAPPPQARHRRAWAPARGAGPPHRTAAAGRRHARMRPRRACTEQGRAARSAA
eukprot:scaffold98851_cov69-Phaeocystis_antarctica.AAC.4